MSTPKAFKLNVPDDSAKEEEQNQAKASAAVVETKKKSEEGKALDEQQVEQFVEQALHETD